MMKILYFSCFFSVLNLRQIFGSPSKLNVTIIVMYSGHGIYANVSDTLFIGNYWLQHLHDKVNSDSSWPFRANVEFFDTLSDASRATAYIINRLANKNLQNVTAIIGPEAAYMTYPVATVAKSYGIPMVPLSFANAGLGYQAIRPPYLSTTVFLYPAAVNEYQSLIDIYIKTGVQSIVFVYYYTPFVLSEANGCIAAAGVAEARGLNVMAKISYLATNTTEDIFNIVKSLRDVYRPDAVIWCDVSACGSTSRVDYLQLKFFKQANYLPKALGVRGDCFGVPLMTSYYADGLFDFVSGGQWFNDKVIGSDYTEAAYPYSSVFRPPTPSYFTVRTSSVLDE